MKEMTGLYRHYKGNLYHVIGMARHSESLEEMVVYISSSPNEEGTMWVRPLSMFTETIVNEGVEMKRFEKV